MNKKIKLLLSASALAMGIISVNPKEAKATLRGRIGNALARICGACIGRGGSSSRTSSLSLPPLEESNLNKANLINNNEGTDAMKNLLVGSDLEARVGNMSNKPIIGAGVDSIEIRKIRNIDTEKYYHQYQAGNKTVTLVSEVKPEVIGSNNSGTVFATEYVDEAAEMRTMFTPGVPVWIKGKDIIENKSKKSRLKIEKYLQSMQGVDVENYYGLNPEDDPTFNRKLSVGDSSDLVVD